MLRLRVLGSLDLRDEADRELRSILVQPRRLALLTYLAVATRHGYQRRDVLRGLFWPELDREHARHALNQAVHVVRRAVGRDVLLTRGDEEVRINPDRFWCDATAFEDALKAGDAEGALALYRGDLLQGFFITGAPDFEHWLERTREALREHATAAASELSARMEARGEHMLALHWARWSVSLSPLDETRLRCLLSLLVRLGDHAAAARAYEDFASRLLHEYDLTPSAETVALVDALRRGGAEGLVPIPPRGA